MAANAATNFSSRLAVLASGLSVLFSGLVLLGWALEIPLLAAFLVDAPPTPVFTALLLLVAGISLWLLHLRRLVPLAALLAAMVLLMGVLGLMETWLHFSSGLQEGVVRLFLAAPAQGAVRMLPHATLAFALLGAALLILAGAGGTRTYFAQALALAVMALGLQALIGLGAWPAGTATPGMALPAALCFLLLGAGTLFLCPNQGLAAILLSKGPGGALLRFIVPVVLLVPNGLILLAIVGLGFGHYGESLMTALLALAWVAVVMAMFFALGVYLNRKGEALTLSEQRYRVAAHELNLTNQLMERIFSNIHVLVAYLDTGFNFIRVNENYAAADQQRSPDFFVGKNHFALYPDAENEAIFRHVLESGEPYVAYAKPFEYADQPELGVTYWDWNLVPVKDENGRIEGLLLTLADVTERKCAEIERLQAEARFHLLFDSAADAIFIVGPEGRFIEVNQVACERLGYSREELLRLSPADIDTPQFGALVQERTRQLFELGRLTFESAHVTRDGRVFPVEINCRVTEFGGQPAVISMVRDISQRKQAEAALRQSEETARALLNATAETAMLMDENGIVLAVNEIGAKRVNSTPEQLVGRNFFEHIPPEVAARRKQLILNLFQTGQPLHLKDERNGIVFESVSYPVFNADDKVVAMAVYAADVTEREQMQALDELFKEIDQQVLRGLPLSGLLEFICAEVARLLGYQFVWVGRKEVGGEISIAASAGPEQDYRLELEKIGVRWDDTPQGHGPAGLTIRLGQTQVFRYSDPGFRLWREAAARFGLKAIAGIPLIIRGEVYGAFTLYSRHEHSFDDPATVQRLGMIAGRICIALEMAMDQQQLRLLGTALASAGNGVFITDRRGRIQWLNQSFSRLTGYSAQEALGETPRIIKSGKQGADYYHKLWQTITRGEVWSSETVEKHKDGSEFTVQQTITPIRDADGEVSHFISILEDITAQKATEARIQRLAHYDALTDLPNRALFYDRLKQVLVQAKRGHYPSALMFLDLDRFKTVNDTLGHHIGDLLLQEVAQRIRSCVRESDTVARLGGDEFTVLLPQVVDRESAAVVAHKIIAVFAEPFVLDGHELHSSTSIGLALYPADAGDSEGLVKCADSAMYEAKQRGRNNYCFFDASLESL